MSEKDTTQGQESHKESMLKTNELNPQFKYEISKRPGAENALLCFQCGTCTADCPIARFSDFYRPRKLIRMIQLGLSSKLLSNEAIWLCSTCFTCMDHCPQDVGIANIIRALRHLTVEGATMPAVYKELASNILKTGYAYKISELRLKKREEKGLPSLSRANLENLEKLFDITGLSGMLKKV
ncbi:CoB--CoM heterodisulfide reductase subunit C [Candidatus Bathyarchaeota archaeon]|nr:CoB--CoM heterodisulfide reductase subunit C [Candidatus Bathyarchaeota archaeon]